MRVFVICRHGESQLNVERRVNGDPAVHVPLTERGEEEACRLGVQLRELPIDACVHTRFGRTLQTANIALTERGVPLREEPLLDDIGVGELDGHSLDDYREAKRRLGRRRAFPGGESLDAAARRYAAGYRRLLELPGEVVLVVCHEIPLRYALNGAAGSDELDGPVRQLGNAIPYLFGEAELDRAVARIEQLAGDH